jgi:hypothetical protein
MTQTGALSDTSPKCRSDHQLDKRMGRTGTSSGSQEQIIPQLWEIIHYGNPALIYHVNSISDSLLNKVARSDTNGCSSSGGGVVRVTFGPIVA